MTRRIALALAVMAWTGLSASAPSLTTTVAQAQSASSSMSIGRLLPKRSALERAGLDRKWNAVVPIGSLNERVIRISMAAGASPSEIDAEIKLAASQLTESRKENLDGKAARKAASVARRAVRNLPRSLPAVRDALAQRGLSGFGADAGPSPWTIDRGQILAQTNLGRLYAFDAETGAPLWNVKLGSISPTAQPIAATLREVVASNLTGVHVIDRATGTRIASYNLPSTVKTAPVALDGRAIVGRMDGVVSALDLQLDAEPYVLTNGETVPRPLIIEGWNFALAAPLLSRPILAKRVVAFGSQDGQVYVVRNETREQGPPRPPQTLHRFMTGGPIVGALGALGLRTLLAPSGDGALYALDLYTGDLIWSYATSSAIIQEPLISDTRIFVQNKSGQIVSLDMSRFWSIEDGSGRSFGLFPADNKANAMARARELDLEEYRNLTVVPKADWVLDFLPGTLIAVSPSRIYGRDSNGSLFVLKKDRPGLATTPSLPSDPIGPRDAGSNVAITPSAMLNAIGLDLREFKETLVNNLNDRMYFCTPDGLLICLCEIGLEEQPILLRKQDPRPFGYVPDLDDPAKDGQDQGGERPPTDNASETDADPDGAGAASGSTDPNP